MSYLHLYRLNPRILSFGLMLVFFSSFGQTFVVSLYIPWFMEDFGISSSFFSGLYAVATLMSAGTLVLVGRKIDHLPLKSFTLFVIAGILIACLVAALSFHLAMLFAAIYLLRLFGQGLLSHTAMTTMGRYFQKARGKALSIAYLGFPLGEALLPATVVGFIMAVGWRETFGLSALFIALVLLPVTLWLLRGFKPANIREEWPGKNTGSKTTEKSFFAVPAQAGERKTTWTQKEVLRSPHFFLFAPTVFLVGFLQTALFFFQTFIAHDKAWPVEWMAASIAAYALSSIVFSMAAGPLIDRFSAARLFPLLLFPLAGGIILLSLGSAQAIAPLFWLMTGITGGISTPVTSSLYAETFGVRSLGSVRSLFTFVMVISTALGPLVYSFCLERGLEFDQIHLGFAGIILANGLYVWLRGRRILFTPRSYRAGI